MPCLVPCPHISSLLKTWAPWLNLILARFKDPSYSSSGLSVSNPPHLALCLNSRQRQVTSQLKMNGGPYSPIPWHSLYNITSFLHAFLSPLGASASPFIPGLGTRVSLCFTPMACHNVYISCLFSLIPFPLLHKSLGIHQPDEPMSATPSAPAPLQYIHISSHLHSYFSLPGILASNLCLQNS